MEPCTAAQLEGFLSAYGWIFRRCSENTWKTGWQGADRYFGLEVVLDQHWIYFTVHPLLHTAIDWSQAPGFLRHLLELNDQMRMTSLSLDQSGHIALRAQALATGFDLESLTHILGILGYYADSLTKDLAGRIRDLRFGEIHAPSHLA